MAASKPSTLQTNDQLMTAPGFDDYILAYRSGLPPGGAPIRVRDVGHAIVAAPGQDRSPAG